MFSDQPELKEDEDAPKRQRNDENSVPYQFFSKKILKTGHFVVPFDKEESRRFRDKFSAFGQEFVRLQPGGIVVSEAFVLLHDHYLKFQFDPSDVVVMSYPKCGTTWMQELVWTMKHNPNLKNPMANVFLGYRSIAMESDAYLGKESGPPCEVQKSTMISAASYLYKELLAISPFFIILLIPLAFSKKIAVCFVKFLMRYCPSLLASMFMAVLRIFPKYFQRLPDNRKAPVIPGLSHRILENFARPRIIKTHLPFSVLSQEMLQKAKVIFVQRNTKDMLVSYYHFCRLMKHIGFTGTLEEFVESFIRNEVPNGNYALHLKEAMTHRDNPNLLIVRYEDMKCDLVKEIKKIDRFIDTKLTDQQILKIAEYTSFLEMRKRNPGTGTAFNENVVKEEGSFFRKGIIGDWKSKFTPELTAKVDQWIHENLNIPGLEFKYT